VMMLQLSRTQLENSLADMSEQGSAESAHTWAIFGALSRARRARNYERRKQRQQELRFQRHSLWKTRLGEKYIQVDHSRTTNLIYPWYLTSGVHTFSNTRPPVASGTPAFSGHLPPLPSISNGLKVTRGRPPWTSFHTFPRSHAAPNSCSELSPNPSPITATCDNIRGAYSAISANSSGYTTLSNRQQHCSSASGLGPIATVIAKSGSTRD
jgi:hypothetical protein